MGTNLRNIREDEEVAVVFTSQVKADSRDGYVCVTETMNTPFTGPGARMKAENFRASESERDFTEADGWQWFIWANDKANKVYGEMRTKQLLGED